LPSAENYWSPELAYRNASVFLTVSNVFHYVVVTPGEHNFFLASSEPLPVGAASLTERLVERTIDTRWVKAPYLEWLFATDRFEKVRARLEAETGVRLNYDLAPICFFFDMALWLTLFGTGLRDVFEATTVAQLMWVLPILLVAAVALR
jgi:hypothetical protein